MPRLIFPILLFLASTLLYGQNKVIYVKHDAAGLKDGSTWIDAYTNLQEAINKSKPGQEIWVAAGHYFPQEDINGNPNPADPRERTFHLKEGISVFGGFKGNERVKPTNPQKNPTILTGDIGVYGDNSDNCYHVMYNKNINTGYTSIRGFIVESGNAEDLSSGGGLVEIRCSITYSAMVFKNNEGNNAGAIYSSNSNSFYNYCEIFNNTAHDKGGGIGAYGSSLRLDHCEIKSNTSVNYGGGYFGLDAQLHLSNSLVINNRSDKGGGVSMGSTNLNWPWPPNKIERVTFKNNRATRSGAALYLQARPAYVTDIVCKRNNGSAAVRAVGHFYMNNSLIHDNPDGGLQITQTSFGTRAKIYHSTLVRNGKQGGSDVSIEHDLKNNKTQFYNTLIDSTIKIDSAAVVEYYHCLMPGSMPGGIWDSTLGKDMGGNSGAKPLYFSLMEPNYRLWKCSPGVDEGDSTLRSSDWFDYDSDGDTLEPLFHALGKSPRIVGSQMDIGAYEYGKGFLFSSDSVRSYSNVDSASSYIWINCQTGQIADSGQVFTRPADSSAPFALVVSKMGCTDTSECVSLNQIMHQPEATKKATVRLYPNPAHELLFIEYSPSQFGELNIFSIEGALVNKIKLSKQKTQKVNIAHLKTGVYILQLTGSAGTVTKKLLKQ